MIQTWRPCAAFR